MRKIMYMIYLIVYLFLISGCEMSDKNYHENETLDIPGKASFAEPPASLDSLYPPYAQYPVFLVKMHEMSGAFVGILSDLFEGDRVNSERNYLAFKSKYNEISELVPEWKELTPPEPVQQLGKALKSGNKDSIMASFGAVEQICHDCHESNMTSVQIKYHWKDFAKIQIDDPVTGQRLPFNKYMQFLDLAFSGIMNDVVQNQPKAALAYLDQFSQRLNTLGEACFECHTTERYYFVDEEIIQSLTRM